MHSGLLEVYQTGVCKRELKCGTAKVIGVQARDEMDERIVTVIIRIRIGYLIAMKYKRRR